MHTAQQVSSILSFYRSYYCFVLWPLHDFFTHRTQWWAGRGNPPLHWWRSAEHLPYPPPSWLDRSLGCEEGEKMKPNSDLTRIVYQVASHLKMPLQHVTMQIHLAINQLSLKLCPSTYSTQNHHKPRTIFGSSWLWFIERPWLQPLVHIYPTYYSFAYTTGGHLQKLW